MDKDVLLGVIPVDEPVAAFHVEPFDGTGDFCSDDFLRLLFVRSFNATVVVAFARDRLVAVRSDDVGLGN